MRWAVRINPEDGDGEFSADFRTICIERSRLEDATELGLPLDDGKRIMTFLPTRRVQQAEPPMLRLGTSAVDHHRQTHAPGAAVPTRAAD
jgi:hypothetical protein